MPTYECLCLMMYSNTIDEVDRQLSSGVDGVIADRASRIVKHMMKAIATVAQSPASASPASVPEQHP